MRTFLRTTVDNSGDAFGCPGFRAGVTGNDGDERVADEVEPEGDRG
jgi:hypothetical protein